MKNNLSYIKEYFNSLEEVKRIHELEPLIDNNKEIKEKLDELLDLQHRLVHSKYYKESNRDELEELYNQKKNELINLPFLEEYLELLDIVDEMLKNYSYKISQSIEKDING